MEPAALSATVEQYNKVCAEGYDSDFAKDPHFLNAVAKAPFYAHVTTPSLGFALVTTGGFVTTNDQQVLNEDYQPIEGLYASGNTCGMRFGPEYITPIPGVSIGMCLTLGRELGKYLAAKVSSSDINIEKAGFFRWERACLFAFYKKVCYNRTGKETAKKPVPGGAAPG